MKANCRGQCKSPRSTEFAPQVIVWSERAWQVILHDTHTCPDWMHWKMNALRRKAKALRPADKMLTDYGLDLSAVPEWTKDLMDEHIEKGAL